MEARLRRHDPDSGTGHWIGPDGSSGEYDVETVIAGDVIESTYRYPGVQPGRDKYIVKMTAKSDGSIEVTGENEQFNGRGYCLEDECFYRLRGSGAERSFSEMLKSLHQSLSISECFLCRRSAVLSRGWRWGIGPACQGIVRNEVENDAWSEAEIEARLRLSATP